MSKLCARIGDKIIEANISEKDEAKHRYDDAIASGHSAVLADKSEQKKNAISLKLGNLLPGQDATLNLIMIEETEISCGAYCYSLPASFYPDYNKHQIRSGYLLSENIENIESPYLINYEF